MKKQLKMLKKVILFILIHLMILILQHLIVIQKMVLGKKNKKDLLKYLKSYQIEVVM